MISSVNAERRPSPRSVSSAVGFRVVWLLPRQGKISHLLQDLTRGYVVVDGSTEQMSPLNNELHLPCGNETTVSPHILRLKNDDLRRIGPSLDPDRGIALCYKDSKTPVFLVAPRNRSRTGLNFHHRKFHQEITKAARELFKVDPFVGREEGRLVLFDGKKFADGNEDSYVCMGPEVPRRVGSRVYSKHAELAPREHDIFQNVAARTERVVHQYIPSNCLCAIDSAQPKFRAIGNKSKECELFASFNVSSGSFHSMHLDPDDDYSYSTIVLFDPVYQEYNDNTIIRYVCFPRLGLAMALRVGDVMVFNSRENYCLSSLAVDRQVFTFEGYIKTAQ